MAASNQTISVVSTSTELLDAVSSRKYCHMTNNGSATAYIVFGTTAVSGASAIANGGHALAPGQSMSVVGIPCKSAFSAITASGSTVIAVSAE